MKNNARAYFCVGLVCLMFSCTTTSNGLTQYEQFSQSFVQETNKANESITVFDKNVTDLSDYEKLTGTLSEDDYAKVNQLITNLPEVRNNMDLQIQAAKDAGNSVTPNGNYTNTGEKVRGWDNTAYANLHVETTLNSLEQKRSEAIAKSNTLDWKLLEKPNKPFNINAAKLFTEIKMDMASSESDIAAKNWEEAKNNSNNANDKLKSAIKLDLNNIELYQVNILQEELKDIANKITLGSALNTTGSILKDAGKGAAGIIQGIGDVLKGFGDKLSNEKQ